MQHTIRLLAVVGIVSAGLLFTPPHARAEIDCNASITNGKITAYFGETSAAKFNPKPKGYSSGDEGGAQDAYGQDLHTLQEFLDNKVSYVTVATQAEYTVACKDKEVSLPSFDRVYGKHIVFKLRDKGAVDTFNNGFQHIDVAITRANYTGSNAQDFANKASWLNALGDSGMTIKVGTAAADGGSSEDTTNPTSGSGGGTGSVIGDTNTGPAAFGSPLSELISEESGFVYQAWRVTRGIINILLIIALLAISFSNITRINIDTYTIKKSLPGLLIGVLLANASLYIIRFMSDITTVVTYFFVQQSGSTDFADFIGDTAQLVAYDTIITTKIAVILILPFVIVTIVCLLWLAFLLYFRLVAIYLLTILSPLAFVSYGIPGFDKYFKQWWQQFTKWLYIVPAMSAVFWLMIVIGRAGDNQSIARLLIMYVLLFTALTLPSKMGGAVIDKASKAFMKYTGANWAKDASLNAVKDYAATKGQQIGYRIPGVAKYQAWRELQKESAKKDIEQLKKRGRNKVLAGRTGLNRAKLEELDKEIKSNEEAVMSRQTQAAGQLRGGLGSDGQTVIERVIRAEYEKKLAEEKKNAHEGEQKLEFLNSDKDEIKNLLKGVFKATIDQEVVSEEVKRAEGINKGNISSGYLQPLQAASNYSRLRADLEGLDENDPEFTAKRDAIQKAMSDIRGSFEELKKRAGNEEYRVFKDIDDFMLAFDPSAKDKVEKKEIVDKYKQMYRTQISIWQGRQRQTMKMFSEGIKGQIKSDVQEQTVAQIERELNSYMKKELKSNNELMKLFIKGDTAALSAQGLEDKDIRSGRVIMEKYKELMRSTNDIRNKDAIESFVKVHNQVMQGTGFEFNEDLVRDASSDEAKDRRAAAGYIVQSSGIVSGQPHYVVQNENPLTPKPYVKKQKKVATLPLGEDENEADNDGSTEESS